MLKSLQMKLVLILMLLVIAVMAVVGTFLINSVTAYNIAEFQNQVANFFQHHSEELEQRAEGDQPVESMEEMLKSYTRALELLYRGWRDRPIRGVFGRAGGSRRGTGAFYRPDPQHDHRHGGRSGPADQRPFPLF